jgi:hypothetical protein
MGNTYKVTIENVATMILANLHSRTAKAGSIVAKEWKNQARAVLRGTAAAKYNQGITIVSEGAQQHAQLVLTGFYPNMI